MACCTPAKDPV